MIQVFYKKSLLIEETNAGIRYWTGIKREETVRSAIRGLAEKGWIKDIYYQKHGSNIYTVNLHPKINKDLLTKMDERSKKTSRAKKKSIESGEAGKFQSGNNLAKKDDE